MLDRYGVPYFLMHRGHLHAALADLVPAEVNRLNQKVAGFDHRRTGTATRWLVALLATAATR